ncbi:MAG: NAD(P)-dependent glycerol-3-phosphate dehydrogenase [Rhodospirillaceae bacterium]|jgi:glycerol-3-phosphate dehydrogenase (NAD(P)+)|nr:NAD(P)-dependent glycerol-3-phosphate dehydrogenase [Rhodospirillaceae bacterium]MBT4043171.1 NAD(P)-dependent glycerol-3-phosphate dehydrogenase [Rhodospirillaceae bacterium]MBT4688040.1 NAD(P)-dependent glycerol-3-phosphate dehydrogenase [Rhodospirillaceae bacterium]MBT5083330.1 NAD(P)-dependent glycerol-3-phosphate dehydrogenase [Rhodospirillaceae bacterium]MBT5526222.1 NAD(P)-dependent glycerol-3-phosphate dehydrogenase [Rhodospirillaceae bacterium]
MERISVIGAGAWGTALAQMLAAAGRATRIWAREEDVVAAINTDHANPLFLPDVSLHQDLRATTDLAEAAAADLILLVTPAQFLRPVTAELAKHLKPGIAAVVCAKGIEKGSFALMSEVLSDTLPQAPQAILSGPTFAIEVAKGLPTAVTLACADEALGGRIVEAVGQPHFRPYWTDDVIGAQIGGAVKNVLAIACGIVEGRKLGANARAALMTRGLAEMVRYGTMRGGRGETLMGLSGLGDLALTCNDAQSRNMSLGMALGAGRSMADILAERRSVAEGAHTAGAISGHIAPMDFEMPICTAMDDVLNKAADIDATIQGMLGRPYRPEQG